MFITMIKRVALLGFLASFLVGPGRCTEEGVFLPSDPALEKARILNLQTQGYGGVLPYIQDKEGRVYVLLGKEAAGSNPGTYCDFGGSVDINPKTSKPYRLISTAREELRQESGMLLKMDQEYLAQNSCFYYNITPTLSALMALMPLNQNNYVTGKQLLDQHNALVAQKAHWAYIEKDDFQWVSLKSLTRGLSEPIDASIEVDVLPEDLRNPWALDTSGLIQKKAIIIRPVFITSLNKLITGLRGKL